MEMETKFAPRALEARAAIPTMLANRIERFGGPEVIELREVPRPVPGAGQLLVHVKAAGVGPWDSWIRTGRSRLIGPADLPLTPGSDIAGVVAAVGAGVSMVEVGDEIYGVTNPQFIGACAEFALVSAAMIAKKPASLSFVDAASLPVCAVTAWQMLFDHARLAPGQTVVVLGGAGNVGALVVQLAHSRGLRVIATGAPSEAWRLHGNGADRVVDARVQGFELGLGVVDAVIDTVGGDLQRRVLPAVRAGGAFVSAVSQPDDGWPRQADVRVVYFIVDVTTQRLACIAGLANQGTIVPFVGTVLRMRDAGLAHEMLEGSLPHPPGKIVLSNDD
jgi:NADPH:quinone reductase-like Zn-dependent oxidoreductase